jgi:hypothetical protein
MAGATSGHVSLQNSEYVLFPVDRVYVRVHPDEERQAQGLFFLGAPRNELNLGTVGFCHGKRGG